MLSVVACKPDTPGMAAAAQAGSVLGAGGRDHADTAAVDTAARQARGGGRPAGGGAGGGRGGRPTPSITLASSDVATAKRDTIVEAVPITGDLHPIETLEIRARIEGNLDEVLVREGQHVSAGQLLARFESSEQESAQRSAEADRASAQTDLAAAQWNLDQSQELFKAGAIAERDLKVAQQTLDAAKAKLAAADARLRSTSVATRDTRVVAPANGVIEKRLAASGEHVTRGTSMFTLVRNQVLELAASVPERQANVVRVGQAVSFGAMGRTFDGRVARVSPTVDPATRAITVYVQVPNADGTLKGGTFASGRVVQRTLNNALTVPASAIHQAQETGQPYVYRIAGSMVDITPVQIGAVDERAGRVEVLSGVTEGDRVIVGNVGTLGRGMQVSILGAEDRGGRGGGFRRSGRNANGGTEGAGRGARARP